MACFACKLRLKDANVICMSSLHYSQWWAKWSNKWTRGLNI